MWLFDSPIYIVLIAIVLGVLVGGAWTISGRNEPLYALGAVVGLAVVMLIVERMVVTDREAIRGTLNEIARDAQNNDLQKIVGHIAKSSPSLVQRAQNEMPHYHFTECRVTKVHKVDVDSTSEPRSAIVEFNVVAAGSFQQLGIEASGTYPRWVRLQMVREQDGQWRVQDYRHEAPQQFLMGDPLDAPPR
jgi:hypothetical protein